MKKVFLMVCLVVGLAGLSYAAVDVRSDSTVVGKTEKLNFVGPSVTQSGTVITVDTGTITGNTAITGNLSATGTLTLSNASTIGWTLISSANTFGTSMCTNGCVFCINGQGTVGDSLIGCDSATADKCLCAGAN